MKNPLARLTAIFALFFGAFAQGATLYVDLNSASPTAPYSDWSTAATNIQDAIDASADGDQIWVTNGIYASSGRVMAGDLTNRVALNKAVTVESVNGPFATVIQGAGLVNGTAAVRCAWLTNNASLIGFTLTRGATRTSGDTTNLESGGGAWCSSSNALIQNCVVVSNVAWSYGSGVYQGTLHTALVSSNSLQSNLFGGALYNSSLNDCTVVSNGCAGTTQCRATNSIVYYNYFANFNTGSFSYCCTTPQPPGAGNFTNAPQFFLDGVRLSINSPCIAAGTSPATSLDIFGNSWANPPSIGCAEAAGTLLVSSPQIQLTKYPPGFTTSGAAISGVRPVTFQWLKDSVPLQDNGHFSGTQSTNLIAIGASFADAGGYQLVASNAFGAVTSAVAPLIIHCVDAAGVNPVAPYTTWETAATNIQDAITVAATNEIVLVTNGIYATGGKSMDSTITNRVSIDKVILVQSVNGPGTTAIRGAWDPVSTNGSAAIRCVWMTNNSILNGFMIYGGATRTNNPTPVGVGGGVWASSNNAVVWNCVIATNYASFSGGGAYSATFNNCTFIGNHVNGYFFSSAAGGGGAARSNLRNCLVIANVAEQTGGGGGGGANSCNATNTAFIANRAVGSGAAAAYFGTLVNCTISSNTSSNGAAVSSAVLANCIVCSNSVTSGAANYVSCTFSYSDTDPLPTGTGNVDVDPQLLADNIHLAQTSPCIGIGTTNGLSGTDIDGQSWNNPPSIGCDEWQPAPVITLAPALQAGSPARRILTVSAVAAGQTPLNYFWLKDGTLLQDDGHYANSATASLTVNNFGPADGGGYQLVASNSFGSVTSQVAQVVIHAVDAFSANPVAPYSSWQTAATNIQDSIDAAGTGEIVLVTNGIYSSGGRAMSSDLTNRVALNKALTVISVNGYASTVIEGQWDSASTNGPGSIRCAWIGDGAALNGFTLRNGATRGGNFITTDLQYGGGAWLSTNGVISDCVLSNNFARWGGGGVAFGRVNNCFLTYNSSQYGGGAYQARLNNCTLRENHCLNNASGAGVDTCVSRNCIISANYYSALGAADFQLLNYPASSLDKFTNCCTSPQPYAGSGNISSDPVFLDLAGFRLAPGSPCRGAGNALYAIGYDLDDELFANPPAIGCDEIVVADLTGPLSVGFVNPQVQILANHLTAFRSHLQGLASELEWSFGDGSVATNFGSVAYHNWTNAGTYTMTLSAYNLDNPSGVSSNVIVVVNPLLSPSLESAGVVSNSFQFSFTGQNMAIYTIQYATNLAAPITWQYLKTIFGTNGGSINIQDTSVTNGLRFYRVQAQ